MKETNITETVFASGLVLKDTGILLKACRFDRNADDGVAIDCNQQPRDIQDEVKAFLRRKPMCLVITDCEVYYN